MAGVENAFEPVEGQRQDYGERIAESWEAISDALSEIDDLPDEVLTRVGHERDGATTELEIAYERAYRQSMARAAESMQRAAAADSDLLPIFAGSGAYCIGRWQAQEAWELMQRTQDDMGRYESRSDVPRALLQKHHDAARQYWKTLLETEAKLAPQHQWAVADKIKRHMDDVQRNLCEYPQWRNSR